MNKRGITLISLIITVIILLILMGISMDLIINKKIFSSAQEVVNKSEKQMDTHQEVTEEARNTIKPPDIATITFMVGSAVFLTKRVMGKIKFPLQQPTGVAQVFDGWYYDAECTQEAKEGDNITQDITLYANMLGITNPLNGQSIDDDQTKLETVLYKYIYNGNVEAQEMKCSFTTAYTATKESNNALRLPGIGLSFYILNDGTIKISHSFSISAQYSAAMEHDISAKFSVKKKDGTIVEIEDSFVISNSWSTQCLVAGTLVTLENGTKKKIEDLTYEDDLLVWDFDNGEFATAKPLWIKKVQKAEKYNHIIFEDGTELNTVADHRVFNMELQKFTYTMNEEDTPIGTKVFKEDETVTKLIGREVVKKEVEYYNIITDYHMNLFANGILTSLRLNNLYEIKDMKFVKDNRKLANKEEFKNISDKYFYGLRLAEQPKEINRGNDVIHTKTLNEYVERLIEIAK